MRDPSLFEQADLRQTGFAVPLPELGLSSLPCQRWQGK
jgi:hypothetical protein